jgi:3-oxoacyl-[acyl-carrier-protein] synthase I
VSALAILAVGASTPIGLDARQTALMLRASKCHPRPSPFVDESGNSLGSVRCVRLSDELLGRPRLVALAAPALRELMDTLPPGVSLDRHQPVVLLLALPEPWDGEPEEMSSVAGLLSDVARSAQLSLDDRSTAIRLGSAGFAALLARAATFSRDVPVIVGAVDSFHEPARMKTLDRNFRLLSGRAGNGFIPSEAACFFLVAPMAKRASESPPLAVVKFVATAEEEQTYPVVARALTKLTTDPRLPRPVPWVLSDANGEHHRVRKFTYTRMRNKDVFHHRPEQTRREHLHTEIGDVGAATAALSMAYATMGFSLGFAPARSALVLSASEGAARSLVFLEAPE